MNDKISLTETLRNFTMYAKCGMGDHWAAAQTVEKSLSLS